MRTPQQILANTSNREIGFVHRQVIEQNRCLVRVLTLLPAALRGHCLGMVERVPGEWLLLTSSSAAATQLRFQVDSLVSGLQGEGFTISSLRVRVVSALPDYGKKTTQNVTVGCKAAEHIAAAAKGSSGGIARALVKLSKTLEKLSAS